MGDRLELAVGLAVGDRLRVTLGLSDGINVIGDSLGLAVGLDVTGNLLGLPWPAAVVGDLVVVGVTVVGATDGFAVGGLGSPITQALLVCPPKAPLQHAN